MARKSYVGEILAVGALGVGMYALMTFMKRQPQIPGVDCIGEGEVNPLGGQSCCAGLEPIKDNWWNIFPKCRPLQTGEISEPAPTPFVGCVATVQEGNVSYGDLIDWLVANRANPGQLESWRDQWLTDEPDCFGLIYEAYYAARSRLSSVATQDIIVLGDSDEIFYTAPDQTQDEVTVPVLPEAPAEDIFFTLPTEPINLFTPVIGGVTDHWYECATKVGKPNPQQVLDYLEGKPLSEIEYWRDYWRDLAPECTDFVELVSFTAMTNWSMGTNLDWADLFSRYPTGISSNFTSGVTPLAETPIGEWSSKISFWGLN